MVPAAPAVAEEAVIEEPPRSKPGMGELRPETAMDSQCKHSCSNTAACSWVATATIGDDPPLELELLLELLGA